MVKVLDASAMMVFLEKESGYEKIKDLFVKAAQTELNLLMTAVNWGEIYYVLVRHHGLQEAEKVMRLIETFPVEIVEVNLNLAKQAALYKAEKKLPFVDAFAAALAKIRKGELMTCDKDFKAVEREIKVVWV